MAFEITNSGGFLKIKNTTTNEIKAISKNDVRFELEKTLDNSGITPHSFKAFMENFLIGRGFAVNNGVMDLRDKDFSVILDYSETTAPTKAKMFSTFVHHVRRLEIKSGVARVVL